LCANGMTYIELDPPAPDGSGYPQSWNNVTWTVQHGTVQWSSSVSAGILGDGSGQPVVVSVHVRDNSTCEADTSVTIPIRTITPPELQSHTEDMCANGMNYIELDPTAPDGAGYPQTWNNVT